MFDLEEFLHGANGGGVWGNVVDQRVAFGGGAAVEARWCLSKGKGGDGGENE